MSVSFVRQLGAESGVQLNPLQDLSALPSALAGDNGFAVAMRTLRGRLNQPFAVDRSNVLRKLGNAVSQTDSALTEAYVCVREALNHGASRAVVSRLTPSEAVLKWIVIKEVKEGDPLAPTGAYSFTVSATVPTDDFVLAIKHLDAHSDGIQVAIHADRRRHGGADVANSRLTLRVYDADGELIEKLSGSLRSNAKNADGETAYLPARAEKTNSALEIQVGDTLTIKPGSDAYGFESRSKLKWARSATLDYFVEGGNAYTNDDYDRAILALEDTPLAYSYLTSAGSSSTALIGQLAMLAYRVNRPLRLDVPGNLDVDGAVAFVEQLNLISSEGGHLIQAFWAPFQSVDPTGLNPRGYYGTATLNIALACARDSQKDANGFAPKQYPIAGRRYPVPRQMIEQKVFPSQQDLDALALARINPVLYETYSVGSLCVFRDSLTMAPEDNALGMLAAVIDMATSIDEFVAKYGKDLLQLPMDEAVRRMEDALYRLFEGATTAGWLVPSAEETMDGATYRYEVAPNAEQPYDVMDVQYWLRYVGTVRQVYVSQILTK